MNQAPKRGTILVVDDNPTNLEVLYVTLDGHGYEILLEMNGERGIKQAQENLPDLIILDVMMPGIGGFEACRRLKNDPKTQDIPIIFLTALSDLDNKVKGLQLDAVDYITKPFQKEEVLARVKTHVHLRQMSLELERKNGQLAQALRDLKETQIQLVQNEKMMGLGRLVAGIAHEINNPVNYIYGNLSYLETCVQKLIAFLDQIQEGKLSTAANIQDTVQQLQEELEISFLREDMPQLLTSMKTGVERIRQMVFDLRNFARLDESEVKPVNIHQGLENSLVLLNYRLQAAQIEVSKAYGSLPEVECNAKQLNQVFVNLLMNAIDAIESQGIDPTYHGQITISTEQLDEEQITIKIKDNGCGIPPESQNQIFDPFFTTKPIGRGTGLGLSISYNIVKQGHQGRLSYVSESDLGTEFTITLPIKRPPATDAQLTPLSPPSDLKTPT
ncbi:response regulator [Spirulina sp. CS-785/01]|uniref:sensor histidine kinase n=1 Tax=Spirulina sp. CS-785/01 TaxID=3021716 RepID=UPI00232AD21A|nr:response regulator [Spirulina sp. CS-785/01]MDB9315793.1 response regulator [Spirulina sp. CS-785/01]